LDPTNPNQAPELEATIILTIAMLHAMALESIVGFFIGCVNVVWRGRNIIHTEIYSVVERTI
jgi:hypothetical protein